MDQHIHRPHCIIAAVASILERQMAFARDLGIHLMELGLSPDTDLVFNSVIVTQLGSPGGGSFRSTSNASFDGSEYAMTIDMDRARLDEFIMACPGDTALSILDVLKERPIGNWSIQLQDPGTIDVSGSLGDVLHNMLDIFSVAPLVAQKIEPSLAPAPVSATVALVAVGREFLPFMNDADFEKVKLQALRSRVVSIGQKLNELGGINMMRSVFNAAVRFLLEEDIHVGRWFESVWDGIGEWRC
jgi:hypothetical protein